MVRVHSGVEPESELGLTGMRNTALQLPVDGRGTTTSASHGALTYGARPLAVHVEVIARVLKSLDVGVVVEMVVVHRRTFSIRRPHHMSAPTASPLKVPR